MTPSARLAALVELLDMLEHSLGASGAPADRLVQDYTRTRRYIGSKDRRWLRSHFYDALRQRGMLVWMLETCGADVNVRSLTIAYAILKEPGLLGLFGGDERYAIGALSDAEGVLLEALRKLDVSKAPSHIQFGIPAWAFDGLSHRFGKALEEVAAKLSETAPLDIRINSHKGKGLPAHLKDKFVATRYSHVGARSLEHIRLESDKAYKTGQIEIQDEAAQIASTLVRARPGHTVIDLCAGAGGKTLAVGAAMAGDGIIHACDIRGASLSELRKRAKRAGLSNLETHLLKEENRAELFDRLSQAGDRVIIDAPCSGSGTWRRNPELRWRYDEGKLASHCAVQQKLLREGADLVKPGGWLIYMTCSLLPQENEDIVDDFLRLYGVDWKKVTVSELWQRTGLRDEAPATYATDSDFLCLDPAHHETDGFFVAILERNTD